MWRRERRDRVSYLPFGWANKRRTLALTPYITTVSESCWPNTPTRLESQHAPCASLPRVSGSPHCSSNYRDCDCRGCNLEAGSGALGCGRSVEGLYFRHYFGNFDRVCHV